MKADYSVPMLPLLGECSSHPSSKKLPFTVGGDHYRKTQLDKMQRTADHRLSNTSWLICNTILKPKEHCRSCGKTVRAKGPWCLLQEQCCLYEREVAPMKSQCYSCLNKTCKMVSPTNTSMWMGKSHKAPSLDEVLSAMKDWWGRKNQSSPGMSPWEVIQS